ncbi:FAD/NAD(P)-binding domain-containing protein [Penicillium daleae]|uniref:FAD/NAD(P)-binding domain-containing protein n=1 Tax=Penicillium daleae TaxID=63821 RepID=A0AAD6BSY5_9EURO|nr:FAD/NAD(P)-binding domain-containing protein [Penicillium daleae]KAJ5432260.1 FAD/NAD(P)-binding domain-containing protein [Penicillium daleae]
MFQPALRTLAILGLLAYTSFAHRDEEVITRDIAIIGGGASGTFSAVRLRDQGKSVILIEKESILGGHTNTYQDPVTKVPVDYGVEVFHAQQIVKDYLDRLNVSWVVAPNFGVGSIYLDGQTAQPINYTSPDLPVARWQELLQPFGDFLAKHPDINNASLTIFRFGQGLGDFLVQPTLYVFKNFGLEIVQALSTGFLAVTSQNNYEIYDHATKLLGSDVLLSSTVISTLHREDNGVTLVVQTPSGRRIVKAKKLLIAIPQKLENLRAFDLDHHEAGLFGQFKNTGYWTSLVTNTGLPAGFNTISVGADTPYNLPNVPLVYAVVPTAIDGIFDIKYGSQSSLPDDHVRREILSYVKKLQDNGFAEKVEPEFVRFNSHTPFELTVSPEKIRGGFYKQLYGLQGYRGTWYTGAAFHTQDSSLLWNFTESHVLPGLLK